MCTTECIPKREHRVIIKSIGHMNLIVTASVFTIQIFGNIGLHHRVIKRRIENGLFVFIR